MAVHRLMDDSFRSNGVPHSNRSRFLNYCILVFKKDISHDYSYFEKGCRKKKDRKVVWIFTGILHVGLVEIYKFVFLYVENLCFLSGAYICSFTFNCCMSLSEENSSKLQRR